MTGVTDDFEIDDEPMTPKQMLEAATAPTDELVAAIIIAQAIDRLTAAIIKAHEPELQYQGEHAARAERSVRRNSITEKAFAHRYHDDE